jgi:hypothetical protein
MSAGMRTSRFDPMPEPSEPIPQVAAMLASARAELTAAGVPEKFWRLDLPADPRLPGIRAYNRGVAYWNALSVEDQRRVDKYAQSASTDVNRKAP